MFLHCSHNSFLLQLAFYPIKHYNNRFRRCNSNCVVTVITLIQVLFWEGSSEQREADRVRVTDSSALLSGLKSSTVYMISVRAQNSAGLGPSSPSISVATKKPRECTPNTRQKSIIVSYLLATLFSAVYFFLYDQTVKIPSVCRINTLLQPSQKVANIYCLPGS